jgi:4-amino-4-deoxy-L-arabinose transferase-like glycosyltransferase
MASRSYAAGLLGVLFLAALIAVVPAGRRPFWSSDEARVALLAQDVLDHGHWLVAEIRGQHYLNKPQLFFWTVSLAALPSGRVTELSASIPPVLASLASVAGVGATGRRLWGLLAGRLAGLILMTTPMQFEMSHQVLPDVMLNAWLVWALYWFVRAQRAGWSLRPLLAFDACLAGALLCKGPQALGAVAAVAVAVAITDGPATLRRLRPLLGLTLVLGVAAIVWLVPYQLGSHAAFEHRVLKGHYVTWYLFGRGAAVSRLAGVAEPLVVFLPWTLFLAAAPWWWRASPNANRRRIVLWTATLWVLFALTANYRSRYMLPVLPGLALLTAEFLTAPLTGRARRARDVAVVGGIVFVAAAAIASLFPIARFVEQEARPYVPDSGWERAVIVALAAVTCAALARGVRRAESVGGPVTLGLALVGILIAVGVAYPARYARAFDVRPLAAAAAASVPPGGQVIGYPDLKLSYDFYLRGRRVGEMSDAAAVAARVAVVPRDVFIMTADRWAALAPAADAGWRVLESARVGERNMVVVGQPAR